MQTLKEKIRDIMDIDSKEERIEELVELFNKEFTGWKNDWYECARAKHELEKQVEALSKLIPYENDKAI